MVDFNTNLTEMQKLQQLQDQAMSGNDITDNAKKKEESTSLFSSIKNKVNSAVDSAEDKVKSTASSVSDKAGSVFSQAKQKVSATADDAASTFKNNAKKAKEAASDIAQKTVNTAKKAANKTKEVAEDAADKVKEEAVGIKNSTVNAAKKTATVAKNVGSAVANSSIVENVKSNAKAVKDVVVNMKPEEGESFGQIAEREAKGVAKLGYRSVMAPVGAAVMDFRPIDKLIDDVADGKFKSQEGESIIHTIKRDAASVAKAENSSNKIACNFVGVDTDKANQVIDKAVDSKKIKADDVGNILTPYKDCKEGHYVSAGLTVIGDIPVGGLVAKGGKVVAGAIQVASKSEMGAKIASGTLKAAENTKAVIEAAQKSRESSIIRISEDTANTVRAGKTVVAKEVRDGLNKSEINSVRIGSQIYKGEEAKAAMSKLMKDLPPGSVERKILNGEEVLKPTDTGLKALNDRIVKAKSSGDYQTAKELGNLTDAFSTSGIRTGRKVVDETAIKIEAQSAKRYDTSFNPNAEYAKKGAIPTQGKNYDATAMSKGTPTDIKGAVDGFKSAQAKEITVNKDTINSAKLKNLSTKYKTGDARTNGETRLSDTDLYNLGQD